MPAPLAIDPSTTAVITMEVQRGVCGDLASMPALAGAVAEARVADSIGGVLAAARAAGATVVHCTFSMPPDPADANVNTPLMAMLVRKTDYLVHGSEAVEVLPQLGPEPGDLVSNRHHGMSPFGGTGLDALLREHGITTLIVTGVSLNVGIPGTVVEAVNHGYRVVVPRDCVVGLPTEYGEAIIENTLRVMSTITTSADVIAAWTPAA
ncbi:MAG: isochorismatase family protein [Ilumatobacteraceae bacterium]|nr:isochorismatase family protein [Ilumatobacteraceae bacterium]